MVGDAVIIERTVEESFKKTAKRLKDPDSAIAFYEKSGLPSLKAVRRMFFTNSGLLFYLRECRILFETVGDVNCFLRLLRSDGIFQMLSDLNSRPRTEEFFKAISVYKVNLSDKLYDLKQTILASKVSK